ncbi:MAG: thioredoxin family protein [Planctomycetota bacterium]
MTAVFGIHRTVLSLLTCLVISALTLTPNPTLANHGLGADDGWTDDAAAAVKRATAESKDMLLLFTGSDWCPPCKRLEEEVFSKAEFGPEAIKNFVLVKFDFPQTRELPPELVKQNEEWQAKYGVSGFPTVILVDKDQLPFGVLGFEEGGPENYLKRLEGLRQKRLRRDEAFAKAAQAEGAEKAKLLDEGLAQLDEGLARVYYESKLEEIGKLDADDALGLRTKWFAAEEAEKQKLVITDILTISRLEKPDRAIAFIDEVLKSIDFEIDRKIEILQIKLNLLQSSGQVDGAAKLLDEMIAMDDVLGETKERLKVKKALQIAGSRGAPAGIAILDEYLAADAAQPFLNLAKAQLMQHGGQAEAASELLGKTAVQAADKPDLLIEVIAARADLLTGLDKPEEALQILDTFADDSRMPTDLRCEALLQKAMIMRETSRRRPALLAENRAIEIADSPELKREMQRVVEQLRAKYGD